jgi:hypothetical protein
MVDKLGQFAKEVTRVSQAVGTEGSVLSSLFYQLLTFSPENGKLDDHALVLDVEGTWRNFTSGSINSKGHKGCRFGDLSKQIEVDARGQILDWKNMVNGIVVQ